ncbi:helix-turn-helix transcriptional regulator [Streptomyces sp. NPDC005813]|uniref:helix-turn-helix domain-containing protein n=1 Tax=Streptomyces sp. NPDC005813 TaxID=3155592 RepID=UPI00340422C1
MGSVGSGIAAASSGESQTDLAVALGVSQAQVSRRQSGTAVWSLADCEAVAAHYGIDVAYLIIWSYCWAMSSQRIGRVSAKASRG